jgi:hypothetical protein
LSRTGLVPHEPPLGTIEESDCRNAVTGHHRPGLTAGTA